MIILKMIQILLKEIIHKHYKVHCLKKLLNFAPYNKSNLENEDKLCKN